MEKAHNWLYVRSKSKTKRLAAQPEVASRDYGPKTCDAAPKTEHIPSVLPASCEPSIVPQPNMDFVLFDDDGEADAVGEEDDSLYGGYGDSEGAGSYLPWTSPSTRLRKNELFIEMFSQAYNSAEDKTAMTTDPGDAEAASGLSEPTPPRGIQVPNQGGDHGQFVGDMAIKIESPVMAVKAITPRKRNHEPVEADPAETGRSSLPAGGNSLSGNHKAQAGQAMPTGQRARVFPDQSGDGDDCFRPKKKSKPDPSEDFTDKSMPDIFHYAHPQI
jgi:hypothetical protein